MIGKDQPEQYVEMTLSQWPLPPKQIKKICKSHDLVLKFHAYTEYFK